MAISMAVMPIAGQGAIHIWTEEERTQAPYVRFMVIARLLDDFRRHPVWCADEGVLWCSGYSLKARPHAYASRVAINEAYLLGHRSCELSGYSKVCQFDISV